nr:hypothetical protein [Tanacetum cinerariifolium]
GRVIDMDENAVKEEDEVRDYTTDTQVERRQSDIYNIDIDHAAKVLTSFFSATLISSSIQ